MTVAARDIAAELRARMPGLGAKKLHKLLYYCQAHHLAVFGSPLYAETVEAWDMGPVVGSLWAAEKRGSAAPPDPSGLDEGALNTVGFVLSEYGSRSGDELEARTHAEPPWRLADAGRRPGTRATIRPEWMREHFRPTAQPLPPGLPAGGAVGPDGPEDSPEALLAWARAA